MKICFSGRIDGKLNIRIHLSSWPRRNECSPQSSSSTLLHGTPISKPWVSFSKLHQLFQKISTHLPVCHWQWPFNIHTFQFQYSRKDLYCICDCTELSMYMYRIVIALTRRQPSLPRTRGLANTYLGQRMSLAIQRGNRTSLLGTLPRSSPYLVLIFKKKTTYCLLLLWIIKGQINRYLKPTQVNNKVF